MTSTTGTVAVRWALSGKEPGDRRDYSIIRDDSGGALATEYGALVQSLWVGNPRVDPRNAFEVLPWVMVGPTSSPSADQRLALAVMEWPEPKVLDADGRPAVFTRYFDVALPDALYHGLSYRTLFAALAVHQLPAQPRLSIAVPPLELAGLTEIAHDIDTFGFDELLAVAVGLFDGTVVLKGQVPPSIDGRLRYLDAVAALLPYGLRADLMVGTWSPNLVNQKPLRLFFSDVAAPGQRGFSIGGGAGQFKPTSPVAVDYVDRLSRLHRAMGTVELVTVLWAARQRAYRFDDTAAVLDVLSPYDLPYAVWQDMKRGAGLAPVRAMFAKPALPKATPEIWNDLIRFLLAQGTKDDIRALAPHLAAHKAILSVLARLIVERGADWGQSVVDMAVSAGAHEALAEELIGLAGAGTAELEVVLTLLARQRFPQSPRLRALLLNDIDLTTRLLITAVLVGGEAHAWISLLGTDPEGLPPWFLAFLDVGNGNVPREDGVKDLAAVGGRPLLALLGYAILMKKERDLFGSVRAFGELFMKLARGDEHLRGLALKILALATHLNGGERAHADLLLTVSGGTPPWAGRGLPGDLQGYIAIAAERIKRVPPESLPTCLHALVGGALAIQLSEQSIGFAIDLARYTPEGDARTQAFTQIANKAAIDPTVIERQSEDMIAYLASLSPDLKNKSIVFQLRPEARRGLPPLELARLCASAMGKGFKVEYVLSGVTSWPHWRNLDMTHQFLRALAEVLTPQFAAKQVDELYGRAVQFVLAGGCGPAVAADYEAWLAKRVAVEERRVPIEKRSLARKNSGRAATTPNGASPPAGPRKKVLIPIIIGAALLLIGAIVAALLILDTPLSPPGPNGSTPAGADEPGPPERPNDETPPDEEPPAPTAGPSESADSFPSEDSTS